MRAPRMSPQRTRAARRIGGRALREDGVREFLRAAGGRRPPGAGSHLRPLGALIAASLAASDAFAAESAYCERVAAIADSAAALLYAPRLEVQAIRFPRNGAVDTGALVGDDVQARAALSFSPLDFYRATRIERVAAADCALHEAKRPIEDAVIAAASAGRLPALRRAATFLDEQRPHWLAAEERAAAALEARVISLFEVQQIRDRAAEIERHREAIGGEIGRLEALRARDLDGEALSARLRAAESDALAVEERAAAVRMLDAWKLDLTAGAAPDGRTTEFFGVASVSVSFGAWAQREAERRVLAARERELSESRSELRDRVRMYLDTLKATRLEAQRSAEVVARRVESLRAMRGMLEGSSAPKAPFARDLLDVDLFYVQAERLYFETWLSELRRLGETTLEP
jgi:hypothetical protein